MRPVPWLIFALALTIGSQSAVAQSDLIDGQVMKVDQSAGKITIKHGPAKRLGMENGMTMVYKAQDPAMLKVVKAGNKIRFDAEQVNGQYTVTKIEQAKGYAVLRIKTECADDLGTVQRKRSASGGSYVNSPYNHRSRRSGCSRPLRRRVGPGACASRSCDPGSRRHRPHAAK